MMRTNYSNHTCNVLVERKPDGGNGIFSQSPNLYLSLLRDDMRLPRSVKRHSQLVANYEHVKSTFEETETPTHRKIEYLVQQGFEEIRVDEYIWNEEYSDTDSIGGSYSDASYSSETENSHY